MSTADESLAAQFDKLPPHSVEAEMCFLASLMLDKGVVPEARSVVPREAFYLTDHQIIFDAVLAVYDRTGDIDAVLTSEELRSRHMLEDIGGMSYLGWILRTVPSAAHWRSYGAVVVDRWTWRQGIAAANDFLRAAWAPHEENAGAAAVTEAGQKFAAASIANATDGYVAVGPLLMEACEQANKGSAARFLRTGIGTIDYFTGGIPIGGMTIVGARPRIGKSFLLKQMMLTIAQQGIPAAIISIEEKQDKIAANLLSALTGVRNSDIVYGRVRDGEVLKDMSARAAAESGLPLYVNDKPARLNEVVGAIAVAARKYKCRAIALDYLQLVEGEDSGRENKNVEITNMSRAIKNAFKHFGVAGVVAAQLNRNNEKNGGVRIPQLSDLRDSGAIEADGDVILMLHREDAYHEDEHNYTPDNCLQINVAKNKSGQSGVVKAKWNGDAQSIEPWDGQEVF